MKATRTNRTNPVLNRPNQGQDSREFLKNLEELMRRNKGGFGAMAFDVGSNQPYRVGGKVLQPNQETPSIAWRPGELEQAQELPEPQVFDFQPLPEPEPLPELPPIDDFPQPPQLSDDPTPSEMLEAIFNEAWTPQLPTTEQLEYRYQTTGETYAVQSMADGTVKYNDGSIRARDPQAPPMPIATMADGTILWDDGFTRQMPPGGLSRYLAGVSGLSQFILGQDQTVTQPYGNYNPDLYGSGYHQGVDFRTRDLQQRDLYAPVSMRIAQIISADSGSPYGNSVLLELPSGEMIRLSHLSSLGQFQEGQVLNPGDLIGMPGSTGNSTGEHLDVEYYNAEGKLDNPNNFKANVSSYSIANQITGVSPYSQPQPQQPQQASTPTNDLISKVAEAPKQALETIKQAPQQISQAIQPMSEFRQDLSSIPEKTAQSAGINTEFGLSEAIKGEDPMQARVSALSQQPKEYNPYRQLMGNISERIGDTLGIPEGALSETIAGGATKRTGQALASEIGSQPEQVPGIRQNIADIGKDLAGKAGQGIEVLKSAGSGIKNLIGQGLRTLTPRREVGEQSSQVAQEVGETAQMSSMRPKADIRDPFFKLGGAQTYSKYIAPDAETKRGGALTMDLFSPDFFSDPNNVANVFGGTYMGKEATDKFRSSEASKLPMSSFTPMSYENQGYGEGAWSDQYRSDVDRINQENQSKVGEYNRQGQEETEKYNKSITDYLGNIPSVLKSAFSFTEPAKPTSQRLSFGNVTKSNAQPNMSYAPNMSKAQPQMSFNRPQPVPVPTPQKPAAMSTPQPQMSFARNIPQMSVASKPMMSQTPVAPIKPVPVPTPPPAPQQPRPTLQDYLSRGKTEAQYYAETGQQSTLDAINREPWNNAGQQMSVGQQQGVSNAVNAASSGNQYVSPSGNVVQNYTPSQANMTDASTGLPVVANNAPYPIQQMADGRIKYSDGSIR